MGAMAGVGLFYFGRAADIQAVFKAILNIGMVVVGTAVTARIEPTIRVLATPLILELFYHNECANSGLPLPG
jgi:hypothetical protein